MLEDIVNYILCLYVLHIILHEGKSCRGSIIAQCRFVLFMVMH